MREIEFRGKREDNGEWVCGYLFKIWERVYILWGTTNGVPNMVEVIPETVGQYTGLKDKKGKKIREGDIVKYRREESRTTSIGVVKFDNASFYIDSGWLTSYAWLDYEAEVIGNFHDNPELLKGGE